MNDLQEVYTDPNPGDLVRVVRCKDCKEYQTDWEPSVPNVHFCAIVDGFMRPEDYCSYGERKDE
jgi:hypothetical protein